MFYCTCQRRAPYTEYRSPGLRKGPLHSVKIFLKNYEKKVERKKGKEKLSTQTSNNIFISRSPEKGPNKSLNTKGNLWD